MDILTYVLARNGNSSNGALTGLTDITIREDGKLAFTISGRNEPIVTSTAIPAASAENIVAALQNNPEAIRQSLDIPDALSAQSYQEIQNIVARAVTDISVGAINSSTGDPIALGINDHTLNLPLAQGDIAGLVKGVSVSDPDDLSEVDDENINKIYINPDGTMSVYALNVNRLVQPDGEELIMGDID